MSGYLQRRDEIRPAGKGGFAEHCPTGGAMQNEFSNGRHETSG